MHWTCPLKMRWRHQQPCNPAHPHRGADSVNEGSNDNGYRPAEVVTFHQGGVRPPAPPAAPSAIAGTER